jgi:hypothetical protein
LSEFLAEAAVLIRPDTTKFRAQLEAELTAIIETAAVPPVVVPVAVVGAAEGTGALAAAQGDIAASTEVSTKAIDTQSAALSTETTALAVNTTEVVANAAAQGALTAEFQAVIAASGRAAKAKLDLVAADTALTAAEKAEADAHLTTDAALIGEAEAATLNARAKQAVAAAALKTALAQERSAAAAVADAAAEVTDANAARLAGRAHEIAAAQTAEHTAALGKLEQGALASTLSLGGIRGATLAASKGFLVGAAAVIVLSKSIKEATSEQEALARVVKILGPAMGDVLAKDAQSLASSFGLSSIQALKFEGSLAEVFHNLGLGKQQTALLSEQVVKLAADMAAFNNVSPDVTLKALQLGISGNLRSLRPFIGALRQADVTNEALSESGKKNVQSLTSQELALARLTLIFRATANQQGAAAARSGELAQQSRILSANLSDLGANFGKLIIPGLAQNVEGINAVLTQVGVTAQDVGKDVSFLTGKIFDLAGASTKSKSDFQQGGLGTLKTLFTGGAFAEIGRIVEHISSSSDVLTLSATQLGDRLTDLGNKARQVAGPAGIVELSQSMTTLIGLLNQGGPKGREFARVLTDLLTKLQLTGKIPVNLGLIFQEAQARAEVVRWWGVARDSIERGINLTVKPIEARVPVAVSLDLKVAAAKAAGPTAELAQAQVNQAEALKHLRSLLGLDPGASRAEIQAAIDSRKLSKSRQDAVSRAFAELSAADAVISTAAGNRVSAAKAAADKIKAARDAADKRITDAITARTTAGEQRTARAAGTPQNLDDLNAAIAARATARLLLRTLVNQIKDADTRRSVTAQLIAAEISADNEVKRLREERKKAREDARQAARDAQQTHLEALLSIAETTTGKSDDRKRLEALIRFDEEQIARLKKLRHRTREQNAQLDAYRVDLAQRNEALRGLAAEQKKGRTFAQDAFTFLQTEKGFVSNLLGNLIPGLATGLVGGSAPTSPANAVPRQVPGGFEQPRGALQAASAAAAADRTRGPSSGQANTTNELLRKILQGIHQLGRTSEHPEAKKQRHTGSSAMDFHIQGTYGM